MPLAHADNEAGAIAATVTAQIVNERLGYSVFSTARHWLSRNWCSRQKRGDRPLLGQSAPFEAGFRFVGETCAAAATVI